MKNLIILFAFLTFAAYSQPVTVKWTGNGGQYSKTTFDQQYGIYGHGAGSCKLALEKEGNYLYGNDALIELQKPIWGNNQTFAELLPVLTPDSGKPTLQISNYSSTDTPPMLEGMYILRRLTDKNTYMYSNAVPRDIVLWGIAFGFDQWKPANSPDYYEIPNPDYIANQALRAQQTAEYTAILQNTLTLMGNYAFPGLPYQSGNGYKWWVKYESDSALISVPVDKNYWLATLNGGTKFIYRPVPTDEMSKGTTYPYNVYQTQWQTRVNNSINLSGELRIRKLLGL